MTWIKKQWKKITSGVIMLLVGVGSGVVVYNNGQKVDVIPSVGIHRLAPDFMPIYANAGKQIELKAGQRYIQIGMVMAGEFVITAFADTLDTDVDIGIIGKFTQCKK